MKSKSVYLFTFMCLLSISMVSSSLWADEDFKDADVVAKKKVTVSIGATSHYAWWLQPVWGKLKYFSHEKQLQFFGLLVNNPGVRSMESLDFVPEQGTVLYGPLLSVAFSNGWSVTASFITGYYKARDRQVVNADMGAGDLPLLLDRFSLSARKYDADILVNKKLNKWLKIFFGPKYQGYEYHFHAVFPLPGVAALFSKQDAHIWSYSLGLGAGLGATVHIVKGLFFLPSVSFLAMAGRERHKTLYIVNTTGTDTAFIAGVNLNASLAYYIAKIKTTIALGGRFQYLYYFAKTSPELYLNDADIFTGINLSVIYTF